jgi:hypothetical protein
MLNHILTALSDYALAFNQDNDSYLFVSDHINKLSGYDRDAFIKDTGFWAEIIDSRDRAQVEKNTGGLNSTGQNKMD